MVWRLGLSAFTCAQVGVPGQEVKSHKLHGEASPPKEEGGQKQGTKKSSIRRKQHTQRRESHTACSFHPILSINTPPPPKKNNFGGFGVFYNSSYPFSLLAPEIKPFAAPNLQVSVFLCFSKLFISAIR